MKIEGDPLNTQHKKGEEAVFILEPYTKEDLQNAHQAQQEEEVHLDVMWAHTYVNHYSSVT